jgi:hypothetical protein
MSKTNKNGTILETMKARLAPNINLENLTPLEERGLAKFSYY